MNSSIIMEIIHNYNKIPYYKYNEYISIKDDRVGRIVSFKIYQNKDKIIAEFNESSQITPFITIKNYKTSITSVEEFKTKWYEYYNFYY